MVQAQHDLIISKDIVEGCVMIALAGLAWASFEFTNVLPGGIKSTSMSTFSMHPASLYRGPVAIKSFEGNNEFMPLGKRTLPPSALKL